MIVGEERGSGAAAAEASEAAAWADCSRAKVATARDMRGRPREASLAPRRGARRKDIMVPTTKSGAGGRAKLERGRGKDNDLVSNRSQAAREEALKSWIGGKAQDQEEESKEMKGFLKGVL